MATKYKQQSNGLWRAKIWDGTYVDQKKHYIYLSSSKSSRDLEKKVLEYETKKLNGAITVKNDITILEYANKWLDMSKGLKEKSTYRCYKGIIDTSLKGWEGLSFDYFNYDLVQSLINDYKDKARTCQLIRLTIKQIGESAESDKLLPKGTTQEILKRVSLPKRKKKLKRALYPEEIKAIKNAPLPPMEKAFVYTLFYSGVRKGEALALTKKDVTNVLTINKAVGFTGHSSYLKYPKTERGIRTIPVHPELKKVLDEYLKDKSPDDLLFTTKGELMAESSYEVIWARIRRTLIQYTPNHEKGFTDLTAHLFRHNFCTQLCYQAAKHHTITTKKIAELLGDTEQMVIEVYSHIVEENEQVEESLKNALKM